MAREHERYTEDLAPYMLGALPPLDAEALEKHLLACGDCQRDLAELRTGAEALARSVEQLEPPPELRERVLRELIGEAAPAPPSPASAGAEAPAAASEVAPERDEHRSAAHPGRASWSPRRVLARLRPGGGEGPRASLLPRPAFAVLATGLVAAVAGVGGWAIGTSGPEEGRTLTAVVDGERLPGASARLSVDDAGENPVLHLSGLRDPGAERTYEMWIQRGGKLAPGPRFDPNPQGTVAAGIPGGLEGVDAVHLTRERAGGASTPTETPVVSVPIRS